MDYRSPAGRNLIRKWSAKELSIAEREEFETLLGVLSRMKQWGMPDFKMLSGKKYQGIGEIRWKSAQGTPIRVAGMQGLAGQYILLVGFTHKQQITDPPDAYDLATDRRKALLNQTGSICEHEEDDGQTQEQ